MDSNGKPTALPNPPGLSCGGASAINNNGQAIGGCGDASGNGHAVLWQNGTVTDLGTFGGPNAVATALNNLGHVVGYSMTSTYAQHGFLWSNGTMTDLGNNFIAREGDQRQGPDRRRGLHLHLPDPRPAAHSKLTIAPRSARVGPAAICCTGRSPRAAGRRSPPAAARQRPGDLSETLVAGVLRGPRSATRP